MCARLDAAENEPSEVSQIGGSAMAMAGGIGLRRRYYKLGHLNGLGLTAEKEPPTVSRKSCVPNSGSPNDPSLLFLRGFENPSSFRYDQVSSRR